MQMTLKMSRCYNQTQTVLGFSNHIWSNDKLLQQDHLWIYVVTFSSKSCQSDEPVLYILCLSIDLVWSQTILQFSKNFHILRYKFSDLWRQGGMSSQGTVAERLFQIHHLLLLWLSSKTFLFHGAFVVVVVVFLGICHKRVFLETFQ